MQYLAEKEEKDFNEPKILIRQTADSIIGTFDDEFYYGRASNPTVAILEKKIAALEHGSRAVVFSAGMAACFMLGHRTLLV